MKTALLAKCTRRGSRSPPRGAAKSLVAQIGLASASMAHTARPSLITNSTESDRDRFVDLEKERLRQYGDEQKAWIEDFSEIFGIYPDLIRKYVSVGNQNKVSELEEAWKRVKLEVGKQQTIEEDKKPKSYQGFATRPWNDVANIVIAEAVVHERTNTGKTYELSGASRESVSETVRPLDAQQMSLDHVTVTNTISQISAAMVREQQLLVELFARPEIRKEFTNKPPNLENRDQRIRAWAAVYREAPRGGKTRLDYLMRFVAEYLQAFTVHSGWDIGESGRTYLSREMPKDLAGRLLQDCGVFAMTVASEVFAAARRAGDGAVSSQLYILPGHVALVIFDDAEGTFYLVNKRIGRIRPQNWRRFRGPTFHQM